MAMMKTVGVLRVRQHVVVACCFRGGGEFQAAETCDEHVVVTRIQIRISNLNSSDLFACKWLRARATKQD